LVGGAAGTAFADAPGGRSAAAPASARHGSHTPPAPQVAREVRAEFLHAWDGYKRFAWGHDEVHPLSGGHSEFFVPGSPIGLSIIEALDTLYVMGLDGELADSVRWIKRDLSFDIDGDFHVFEAIIRVVGGLLAGHLATGDKRLLDLTVDVTDRLMPAFTKSPTGMPYQHVNFRTGAVSGATPPLAEIGTNIMEFGLLSRLTGDSKYYDAAKRAYRSAIEARSSLDLLATSLNVETGRWADSVDNGPNPPTDSFYEYLWGGWKLLGDKDCRDWFRLLNGALVKHSEERYDGRLWFKQIDYSTGALLGRGQSELGSFYAELLSASGDRARGEAYYRSWTDVLDRYPVLPESIDYTTLTPTTKGNQFRPEYVNSSFDLYLQTGKRLFADTAYQYFQGMKANARTANGYTIIDDVTVSPMVQGDLCPAYGFAENFKYLYLMFAHTPRFDRHDYALSTEGKVLRGLRRHG
ncbi:glycoside hydrolase family 47 protein, partial [Streptomyces montanisoli]|uniref:glycoside hydrolase family 47 protein n=1 Tax=Streptomyces montanisoli TaxID=2798581 RepID=UPI0027DE34DC